MTAITEQDLAVYHEVRRQQTAKYRVLRPTISVSMDRPMYEAFRAKAKEAGLNTSIIIRQMIKEYLEAK